MSLPTVNDASAPLSKQSAGVGGKGGDVGGARGGGGGDNMYVCIILWYPRRDRSSAGALKKGARNFPTLGFSHIIIYYFKIYERNFWMQTILYYYARISNTRYA